MTVKQTERMSQGTEGPVLGLLKHYDQRIITRPSGLKLLEPVVSQLHLLHHSLEHRTIFLDILNLRMMIVKQREQIEGAQHWTPGQLKARRREANAQDHKRNKGPEAKKHMGCVPSGTELNVMLQALQACMGHKLWST